MKAYLPLFLMASGSVPLLAAPPPSFATREALPLLEPIVTLADFNKDGFTDIIAAISDGNQYPANYLISVQFGNSKGTFTQGPTIDLGAGFVPNAIASADLNGDGLPDIAVVSASQSALYVLVQQPSGGFLINPISLPANTASTQNIAIADMNRDGLPDVIVPTSSGTLLYLNSGKGHFKTPLFASVAPSSFVLAVDLNNDKREDLVVTSTSFCCSNTSVSVLLGDGRGGFIAPEQQPSQNGASQVAVADLNGDGKLDLITSGYYGLYFFSGNGNGTFGSPFALALPTGFEQVNAVTTADINSDGIPDLLAYAVGVPGAAVCVYLNGGRGAFGLPAVYSVESLQSPNIFLGVGDVNGDARPDVVFASPGSQVVSVLLNSGAGVLRDGETISTNAVPLGIVSGDFNSDGKPDLAVLESNTVTSFLNTGNDKRLFAPGATLPLVGQDLVAGDFNSDGKLDIALLSNGTGQTLLGNGDGTFFELPGAFSFGPYSVASIAADVNGDGKLDLVSGFPTVALGHGDGTFAPPSFSGLGACYQNVLPSVADFNRDGKPDILIGCQNTFSIYFGNGDGTFQYPTQSYYPGLLNTATGDFNHDGIPDIVFSSNPYFYLPASTEVSVLIGLGNGTFIPGQTILVPTGTSGQLVVGDFNGNGILDIAVLDNLDAAFSIISGNGDGTFQPAVQTFGIASNPTCMLSGRFAANSKPGKRDLVFCTGPGIGVAINTTP